MTDQEIANRLRGILVANAWMIPHPKATNEGINSIIARELKAARAIGKAEGRQDAIGDVVTWLRGDIYQPREGRNIDSGIADRIGAEFGKSTDSIPEPEWKTRYRIEGCDDAE